MTSASSPIEIEVGRIRDLSKSGRNYEALAAAEALTVTMPNNRDLLYLIAANQRCLNRISEALATLHELEQRHPRFSLLYQERGYCYVSMRDAPHAIEAFLRGVSLNPALATSWSMLARLYRMMGELENAATADEQISNLERLPPEVVQAGSLFSDGALSAAENILRAYLLKSNHFEALRLLGRIEHESNVLHEAELLLEAALKLDPDYQAARLDYVRILMDRQKYLRALDEINVVLSIEPGNKDYLALSAAAHAGLGRHESAIVFYR